MQYQKWKIQVGNELIEFEEMNMPNGFKGDDQIILGVRPEDISF